MVAVTWRARQKRACSSTRSCQPYAVPPKSVRHPSSGTPQRMPEWVKMPSRNTPSITAFAASTMASSRASGVRAVTRAPIASTRRIPAAKKAAGSASGAARAPRPVSAQ